MKRIKFYLLSAVAVLSVTSCFEDRDDNLAATSNINDFVWKAMNAYYLFNENVPDLSNDRFGINAIDNRFGSTEEYSNYLNGFSSPEDIFNSLLFQPGVSDRFSRIEPNFFDLIQQQQGTSLSNGIEFNLYFIPGSSTEIFGVITLVLNNSVADNAGLQRGQIFRAVDGVNLNLDNRINLLSQDVYTLNFADYNDNGTPEVSDDSIVPNAQSTELTKEPYTENPIHRSEVININGQTIGYLAYNGFNNNFINELNAAFGQFQSSNIQHLVLDLRYNGGGVIQTAADLGSMITGQFNGQVFSKAFFNNNQLEQDRDFNFSNSLTNGSTINSLNLNKVYVLTTNQRTASASELVINSLKPYIEVVQIGENTVGKTEINRLVFDSPDFQPGQEVNPTHTYALIPLIGNSSNRDDELVPADGLTPDIQLSESPRNFGILGDVNEPLLAAAIADILGSGRSASDSSIYEFQQLKYSTQSPIEQLLFIE